MTTDTFHPYFYLDHVRPAGVSKHFRLRDHLYAWLNGHYVIGRSSFACRPDEAGRTVDLKIGRSTLVASTYGLTEDGEVDEDTIVATVYLRDGDDDHFPAPPIRQVRAEELTLPGIVRECDWEYATEECKAGTCHHTLPVVDPENAGWLVDMTLTFARDDFDEEQARMLVEMLCADRYRWVLAETRPVGEIDSAGRVIATARIGDEMVIYAIDAGAEADEPAYYVIKDRALGYVYADSRDGESELLAVTIPEVERLGYPEGPHREPDRSLHNAWQHYLYEEIIRSQTQMQQ